MNWGFRCGCAMVLGLAAPVAPAGAAPARTTQPSDDVRRCIPADAAGVLIWDGWGRHRRAYEASALAELMRMDGVSDCTTAVGQWFGRLCDDAYVAELPAEVQAEARGHGADVFRFAAADRLAVMGLPSGADGHGLTWGGLMSIAGRREAAWRLERLGNRLWAARGQEVLDMRIGAYKVVKTAEPDGEDRDYTGEVGAFMVEAGQARAYERLADTVRGLGASLADAPSYWSVHAQLGARRPFLEGYLSVEGVLGAFGPSVERPPVADLLRMLGVDRSQALGLAVGFDGRAIETTLYLHAPAPRRGLLALCDGPPLTEADLDLVPADSIWFGLMRLSYARFSAILRAAVKAVVPAADNRLEHRLAEVRRRSGVDIERDMAGALGDRSALVLSRTPAVLNVPLPVVVFDVRDRDRLDTAVRRLVCTFAPATQPARDGSQTSYVRMGALRGWRLYEWIDPRSERSAMGLRPTLAIGDRYAVLGYATLSVSSAVASLSRPNATRRARPEFVKHVAPHLGRSVYIGYSDVRALTRIVYGYLPFIEMAARKAGLEALPLHRLPPVEQVNAVLFPAVESLTVDDGGMRLTRRGPLPLNLLPGDLKILLAVATLVPNLDDDED